MNTKERYDIIGGPNKDALFDACKYAYSRNGRPNVDFAISLGYTTPPGEPGCAYVLMAIKDIRIQGINHEDGSGESFLLYGDCKTDLNPFYGENPPSYEFEAYYNAKNRKGWIKFK